MKSLGQPDILGGIICHVVSGFRFCQLYRLIKGFCLP